MKHPNANIQIYTYVYACLHVFLQELESFLHKEAAGLYQEHKFHIVYVMYQIPNAKNDSREGIPSGLHEEIVSFARHHSTSEQCACSTAPNVWCADAHSCQQQVHHCHIFMSQHIWSPPAAATKCRDHLQSIPLCGRRKCLPA